MRRKVVIFESRARPSKDESLEVTVKEWLHTMARFGRVPCVYFGARRSRKSGTIGCMQLHLHGRWAAVEMHSIPWCETWSHSCGEGVVDTAFGVVAARLRQPGGGPDEPRAEGLICDAFDPHMLEPAMATGSRPVATGLRTLCERVRPADCNCSSPMRRARDATVCRRARRRRRRRRHRRLHHQQKMTRLHGAARGDRGAGRLAVHHRAAHFHPDCFTAEQSSRRRRPNAAGRGRAPPQPRALRPR